MYEKYPIQDVKMVLVVNNGLKMGKGKIGAQCGHAALAGIERAARHAVKSKYWREVMSMWHYIGVKKICVKVDNTQ